MNKKEISEIKKQFSPNNCAITRICGCYVDGEKNKKTELKEAFLSLSEEEMFKYFEIFKKTLSGTIGKNLINMEFPLDQEKEGGTQEFLMKLRGSKLQDNAILEEFYDKIIENYDYGEIGRSFNFSPKELAEFLKSQQIKPTLPSSEGISNPIQEDSHEE